MSNSLQTVLQELNQKSMTLGWDVVIACNAQKINELFALQYVNNVKANTHLPPITGTLDLGNNLQLQLASVTIGPPLISFVTTPGSQDAIITMNLLMGDV